MEVHGLQSAEYLKAYGILCAPVKRAGGRDGLYPTFCRIPAGEKTTRHQHFEPELFYIIKGQGRMEISGVSRHVREGELVRIPPSQPHELHNNSREELVFLSVYSEDFEIHPVPARATVTAAPPTPNGPLHLGHISGPYLAADIVSKYLRLRSSEVVAHTGTDDHQNYVSARARSLDTEPEVFRERMRRRIESGLEAMHIRFDECIEPKKDPAYQTRVTDFARRALAKGVIQKETVLLPHCAHCEQTLVDANVEGLCPVCREPSRGGCESCGVVVPPQDLLEIKCGICSREAGRFAVFAHTFELGRYLPAILADLEKLNLTPRLRELIAKVAQMRNLKVLVSHPGHEGLLMPEGDSRMHVWFEMAAHYERFAFGGETWVHAFGFDNSFYYLLFIPALLRAMNPRAKLPDAVLTNEFLLLDGLKFSTSRNHAIWADEFKGDSDFLRLYLCMQRPHTQQTNFSLMDFQYVARQFEQQSRRLHERARAVAGNGLKAGTAVIVECNRFTRDMERFFQPETFDPRQAARRLLAFMDYVLQMEGDNGERLALAALATAMQPLMPSKSESLMSELRASGLKWIPDWTVHA